MIPVIGIIVVFGCIAGGYLMERGNMLVLMQPAELLIIGGAALGTVLIGNPLYILKAIVGGVLQVFKGSRYSSAVYLDTLKFLNDFFNTARKNGLSTLEQDLDEPEKSALFKRHPTFYKDKEAMHFFCDTMRTQVTGGVDTHDLDHIMETDLEILQRQGRLSASALTTVADSLPGLGIVAAVLGGVLRWTPGRDWTESSGRSGGNISGHSVVLWSPGSGGSSHQKTHGRGRRVPYLPAHGLTGEYQGTLSVARPGSGAARHSASLAADVSGNGQGLPQNGQ